MSDAINILLRAELDSDDAEKGLSDVKGEIKDIKKEIEKVERAWSIGLTRAIDKSNKRLEKTQARMEKISSDASKLEGVFSTIGLAGAGMLAPIFLSANKYVDSMREMGNENDEIVRQWTDSNSDIEKSFQRIGRVSAGAIIPLLGEAANFAEKDADFVD